jgi:hypothetical protein
VSSRFRFAVSIANIETRLVLGTIRGDKRIDWETDQNKFEEMLVRDTIIDADSYYKTQIGPK